MAFLTTACISEEMCDCEPEHGILTFSLKQDDNSGTRAYTSQNTKESQISSIQILLFDSSGSLVDRGSYTGTDTEYVFSLPFGTYTACVFANVPELPASVSSLSSIDALYIDYYSSDMFSERLHPMYARVSLKLSEPQLSKTILIRRYESRFNVTSIENRLANSSIKLQHVYLTNIQGGFYYTATKNTSYWYSKFGRPDVNASESARITSASYITTKEFSYKSLLSTTLANGGVYTPTSRILLYAFPNYSTADRNGWTTTFTERQTRIVLAVQIDGNYYYYPVNLLNMSSNTSYDVKFVITRLGSQDPDTFEWTTDDEKDVTIDFGDLEDGDDIIIEF